MTENLQRATEVQGVEAIVKGEKHLDGIGFLNCTHFDGIGLIVCVKGNLDGRGCCLWEAQGS